MQLPCLPAAGGPLEAVPRTAEPRGTSRYTGTHPFEKPLNAGICWSHDPWRFPGACWERTGSKTSSFALYFIMLRDGFGFCSFLCTYKRIVLGPQLCD